jgi:hypothetical protein
MDESAPTAVAALETLFREHGAPLVLKSDNGSAFIAKETQRLLDNWRIWHLRSPPEWPEYNGAFEAGIGSMKTRTHHESSRGGHSGEWTCDDVEAARLQANQTGRPMGLHGPTPQEAWDRRIRVTLRQRRSFAAAVRELEAKARREQGLPVGSLLNSAAQAAVWRIAIPRALAGCGFLEFRRP